MTFKQAVQLAEAILDAILCGDLGAVLGIDREELLMALRQLRQWIKAEKAGGGND